MKKFYFVTVITVMLYSLSAEWVHLNNTEDIFTYEQGSRADISLDFQLDGYFIEDIERNGMKFCKLDYPSEGKILQTGMPDLPIFSRLIAIPDQGSVSINIIDHKSHFIKNINILPQQEFIYENHEDDSFIINSDYYEMGGVFPEQIVKLDAPAIMRDIRFVKVSFYPFRYNAKMKELQIFDEINVSITTAGNDGKNCKITNRPHSKNFSDLYASSILNYSEFANERDDFQKPSILIIYPQFSNILSVLDYFIDWKEQKGFEVNTANTNQTGSSSSQIKNYIQNAYDSWENPPEYVILIGDVNGSISLPSWYETWSGGNGIGDHPYSQLEGDDILADVMLGRLSVSSIYELQTVVSKSINYEKDPYLDDPNWYNRAILYAFGGPGKIATCNTVGQYMSLHNPDYMFSKIYYNNFVFNLNMALNTGAAFLCYRGQGVDDGWDNNNIHSLYNGWMLPFAVFSTCYTNDFGGYSKTEAFLRAGSSTLPKGGIASIGSSTGLTSGCFNNAITNGVFYGIFIENIFSTGAATNRGKLNLYIQYPDNQLNHVSCWSHCNNLMGDPSIDLFTAIPQPLNVDYDNVSPAGMDFLQVNVSDQNGTPLENAWVTARDDFDFHQTGFTDSEGNCFLNISESVENNEYELTVTAHNKIPFEDNFEVIQQSQNPVINSITFLDSNNQIPNPGENVNLEIVIENSGSQDINDLQANLITNDDYIQIVSGNSSFGSIPSGEEITNNNLEIYILNNAPGNLSARLDLQLSSNSQSWSIPFFIDVYGAIPNILNYSADDMNGIIDPGESVNIYFTVENIGSIAAENISGELHCSSYQLEIADSTAYFGTIEPGNSASNQTDMFMVSAAASIIPGNQIPINIDFTNPDGFSQSADFLLNIGEVSVFDPLGPDQYGYYCYDDEDTQYNDCPVYDWQEINNLSDPLPIYTLGDSASIAHVDLPDQFGFSFYGETYNSITVASAGWICPGYTDIKSFMNWQIPGPGGPSPMIAAFWDDLHYGYYSNIYTWHDPENHTYIIEWYRLQNENNNQDETFQIIIYDSNYYPTTSGDSKIKIQYQEISNANSGIYPYHGADHGMYCTIGIEDHSAQNGLQYTFNDTYPTPAKTLQNEMAILFTSMTIPENQPFITLDHVTVFSGDDQFIESGEESHISLTLWNIGMQNANNIMIEASENDQYISMINNSSQCNQIGAGEFYTINDAFSFNVSENVPDYYQFIIYLNISSNENSWNYNIPLTAYHSNILAVVPQSIQFQLPWGEQDSTSFQLSNLSDQPLNFYIRTDETTQSRDISGSYIDCNTSSFTPGESTSWSFTAYNNSTNGEWITDIWLDFPVGVTVENATNFLVDNSGDELVWDGSSGSNPYINWHGETVNGWGLLHDGQYASAIIDVTLGNEFAGDLVIPYTFGGDGYGNEPHQISGEIILEYPLRWINLNTSYGTLQPEESQSISVFFDSNDIPESIHTCNIVITSDGWDTKTIPVTLTPLNNDSNPDQLTTAVNLNQNYPNPFNPHTTITYQISGDVEYLNIDIYNIKGQHIVNFPDPPLTKGTHNITWNGKNNSGLKVPSGIYFLNLNSDSNEYSIKMLMIK